MRPRRSSDFGGFVSAQSSTSSPNHSGHIRLTRQPILQSDDLLGSFDDVEDARLTHKLLVPTPYSPDPSQPPPPPVIVQLPPRPDEISPDYVPPPHPNHPPYPIPTSPKKAEALSWSFDEKSSNAEAGPSSKSMNNLATTVKAANKWRRSIDRHAHEDKSSLMDLFEDWPSLVTHDNPFVKPEPIPGFRMPPAGAPGFVNLPELVSSHSAAEFVPPDLHLAGRRAGTQPVLNKEIGMSLLRHLPARQRLSKTWSLIFSLDQHGASLSSLYRHAEAASSRSEGFGSLLIIEDGEGRKFGSFLNESIVRREGSFYGSGESFLFKIPRSDGPAKPPPVFRWTGKNQYFALCESSFISFGAGAGTYGLIFDSTFSRCSSATCPTYDNEVLCSATPRHSEAATHFDCVGLEIWATTAL